jgi:hypothetical protein
MVRDNLEPFCTIQIGKLGRSKSEALVELSKRGLPVPPTIVGAAYQPNREFLDVIQAWRKWDKFYLRLLLSDFDYPHYKYELVPHGDISSSLNRLRSGVPGEILKQADFVLQPLLRFDISGASVIRNKRILYEQVEGAPASLLRGGTFQLRTLHTIYGECLAIQKGLQSLALRFDGNQWVQGAVTENLVDPSLSLVTHLTGLFSVQEVQVLELGWISGQPIFVDAKRLTQEAYRFMDSDMSLEWLPIFDDLADVSTNKIIERPVFEMIADVKDAAGVQVTCGAACAHLCVHLAEKRIPCRIGNQP